MLRAEWLTPDRAGMRPKLEGPGESFRDFVIEEDSARGLPGFVNLAGIESPGLTAAPCGSGALRRGAAPIVHADTLERHVLVIHAFDVAIAGAAEIGDSLEVRQRVARDALEAPAEAVANFVAAG